MGVYTRYKKDPEGFRKLVELLETTPQSRRQRMVEVGMQDDPVYTEKALSYIITFKDILEIDDSSLKEIIGDAPARSSAISVIKLDAKIKERFLNLANMRVREELRDTLEMDPEKFTLADVGAAQLKLVSVARSLERNERIQLKKIPPKMTA